MTEALRPKVETMEMMREELRSLRDETGTLLQKANFDHYEDVEYMLFRKWKRGMLTYADHEMYLDHLNQAKKGSELWASRQDFKDFLANKGNEQMAINAGYI